MVYVVLLGVVQILGDLSMVDILKHVSRHETKSWLQPGYTYLISFLMETG